MLLERSDGAHDIHLFIITRYDDRDSWSRSSINRCIVASVLCSFLSERQHVHEYEAHHTQDKEYKEESREEVGYMINHLCQPKVGLHSIVSLPLIDSRHQGLLIHP